VTRKITLRAETLRTLYSLEMEAVKGPLFTRVNSCRGVGCAITKPTRPEQDGDR
jgi:hypothetical protein